MARSRRRKSRPCLSYILTILAAVVIVWLASLLASLINSDAPEAKIYQGRLDLARKLPRNGKIPVKVAVVIHSLDDCNAHSIVLFTVIKQMRRLGYIFQIHSLKTGRAKPLWEQLGRVVILQSHERVNWLTFQGVVVDSLEAEADVSRLSTKTVTLVPVFLVTPDDSHATLQTVTNTRKFHVFLCSLDKAFASECAIAFGLLLEANMAFPSHVLLPGPVSRIGSIVWEREMFRSC